MIILTAYNEMTQQKTALSHIHSIVYPPKLSLLRVIQSTHLQFILRQIRLRCVVC